MNSPHLFRPLSPLARICFAAVLLGLLILSAPMAQAFDYKSVLAEGAQARAVIDADFEARSGRKMPLHFTAMIPTAKDRMQLKLDTSQAGHYMVLSFFDMDGNILEKLDLREATIPEGPLKQRLAALAAMIRDQVFPGVTAGQKMKLLGVRESQIAGYPAVELVALYKLPDQGDVGFRIVGVIPPRGENVLLGLSHTVIRQIAMQKTADLQGTLAGTTLNTVQFTATRGADGGLISFE